MTYGAIALLPGVGPQLSVLSPALRLFMPGAGEGEYQVEQFATVQLTAT